MKGQLTKSTCNTITWCGSEWQTKLFQTTHQPNHHLQQRKEICIIKLYYASHRNWNVGKYCMIFSVDHHTHLKSAIADNIKNRMGDRKYNFLIAKLHLWKRIDYNINILRFWNWDKQKLNVCVIFGNATRLYRRMRSCGAYIDLLWWD